MKTIEEIAQTIADEATKDPGTGWMSNVGGGSLPHYDEQDLAIYFGIHYASIDVGQIAEIVQRMIREAVEEARAELLEVTQRSLADAWDEGDKDREFATKYSTVAGVNPYRKEN